MGATRIFQEGGSLGSFLKIFWVAQKVVRFVFSLSKLRKQPFLAEILNMKGEALAPLSPLPTPMSINVKIKQWTPPWNSQKNSF